MFWNFRVSPHWVKRCLSISMEEGFKKTIRAPILEAKNIEPFLAIDEKTLDRVCYTVWSNGDIRKKIVAMADILKSKHLGKILAALPNNIYCKKPNQRSS